MLDGTVSSAARPQYPHNMQDQLAYADKSEGLRLGSMP